MRAPKPIPISSHEAIISELFSDAPEPINADQSIRVQVTADDAVWQPSKVPGLSLCVLEHITGAQPRLTALARVNPAIGGVNIPAENSEILVQHGIVADDESEYLHPYYLRQPNNQSDIKSQLTLHAGSKDPSADKQRLEFYIATGQLADTDNERRCINLADHNLWLPGPEENTQVMPLHMHNGSNAMLVRWLDAASFRPKLDPLGEEVLVISGSLSDELGIYEEGSWIRNPVISWQAWSGSPGTLIYYKNGHFE